jgi:hypothetical protein
MFLHYSDTKIDFDPNWSYRGCVTDFSKPPGFWFTDTTKNNWSWWCKTEQYPLGSIEHQVQLKPKTKLLTITSKQSLLEFNEQYKKQILDRVYGINWQQVIDEYDGIYISPYIWSLRLDLLWYYGWDCASGVIWNLNMIQSVTPTKE